MDAPAPGKGAGRRALGPAGAPLALAYRLAVAARNLAYDRGWRRVEKLPAPVVSVGNLTAGGTGKTPAVEWVVSRLRALGRRPAVLLRGYGAPAKDQTGAAGPSEEVLLLRENGDSELVVVGPNIVGGEMVQLFIPGNTFHTARITGKRRWFLGGSTEWPGVVPSEDVELGNVEELAAKYPEASADIRDFPQSAAK